MSDELKKLLEHHIKTQAQRDAELREEQQARDAAYEARSQELKEEQQARDAAYEARSQELKEEQQARDALVDARFQELGTALHRLAGSHLRTTENFDRLVEIQIEAEERQERAEERQERAEERQERIEVRFEALIEVMVKGFAGLEIRLERVEKRLTDRDEDT